MKNTLLRPTSTGSVISEGDTLRRRGKIMI